LGGLLFVDDPLSICVHRWRSRSGRALLSLFGLTAPSICGRGVTLRLFASIGGGVRFGRASICGRSVTLYLFASITLFICVHRWWSLLWEAFYLWTRRTPLLRTSATISARRRWIHSSSVPKISAKI